MASLVTLLRLGRRFVAWGDLACNAAGILAYTMWDMYSAYFHSEAI